MKDLLIINFKTYSEGTGRNAIKIAKASERALKKIKGNIILVPQSADIRLLKQNTKITLFAQHIDVEEQGGHTGSINIDTLITAGIKGTLINHSEKRIPLKKIEQTIKLCKTKKIISVVCTRNLSETKKVLRYKPDYIAVEPPELIGGYISISNAKPKLIEQTAHTATKTTNILCGAGIHKEEDIRVAKELGASGALVASGIIKAKNPRKK
jgi:triosephosphate isomerase (TIM)